MLLKLFLAFTIIPFIEIYLDPLNDYKISWYYPHEMDAENTLLLSKYFGKQQFVENDEVIYQGRFHQHGRGVGRDEGLDTGGGKALPQSTQCWGGCEDVADIGQLYN